MEVPGHRHRFVQIRRVRGPTGLRRTDSGRTAQAHTVHSCQDRELPSKARPFPAAPGYPTAFEESVFPGVFNGGVPCDRVFTTSAENRQNRRNECAHGSSPNDSHDQAQAAQGSTSVRTYVRLAAASWCFGDVSAPPPIGDSGRRCYTQT